MNELISALSNTYIKNDKGELRAMYVTLCLRAGPHSDYPPEAYKWPWVFDSWLGIVQHAQERKYARESED